MGNFMTLENNSSGFIRQFSNNPLLLIATVLLSSIAIVSLRIEHFIYSSITKPYQSNTFALN